MSNGPLIEALHQIAPLIRGADPSDCPILIGILEQLKAQAWARMVHQQVSNDGDKEDLLDMAQVAKRLNIPECRAYDLARQGMISTVKIGKYVRVSRVSLAKYQTSLESLSK